MEHNIEKNGKLSEVGHLDTNGCSGCNSFFNETESGRHVPRAILVDLEPTVIGKFNQVLWHAKKMR